MRVIKVLFPTLLALAVVVSPVFAGISGQLGVGYGMQFLGNTDLEQFELFWRQPLPYSTTLADTWKISTDLELSGALLQENGGGSSDTGRISLMPQLHISPHEMINFIVGFGAGYMVGETEFDDHNLGGSFMLSSKLGVQLLLGGHWGLEYVYYHQSNAGLYDYNASLNMHQLALSYNF